MTVRILTITALFCLSGISVAQKMTKTSSEPIKKVVESFYSVSKKNGKLETGYPVMEDGYHRKITHYDTGQNITMVALYDSYLDSLDFTRMNYDQNQNKTEMAWYKERNELFRKETYEYNEKSQLIASHLYKGDNTLSYTINFEYKGNSVKELWRWSDGSLIQRVSKKYKNDLVVEQMTFSATTEGTTTTTFDYDDGLLVEETEKGKYGSIEKRRYSYDTLGNRTLMTMLDTNDKVILTNRRTYSYDNKGNWIECIEYRNDHPSLMIIRKITYY